MDKILADIGMYKESRALGDFRKMIGISGIARAGKDSLAKELKNLKKTTM